MTTQTPLNTVTIPQAIDALHAFIVADIPTYFEGRPGLGKSQMVAQVAQARGAVVVDVRLAMWESVDLRGLPAIVDGKTVWIRPGVWPVDPDRETILFFDEMDRPSSPAVLGAALQIVLEKRIGEHVLPASTRIVAAGNGVSDRGTTTRLPLALANRFAHFTVIPDAGATRDHFAARGIDPVLVGFLHFRPLLVYTDATDGKRFATPRQWERVASLLNLPAHIRARAIAALVGDDVAREFEAFYSMWTAPDMPRIADILADPLSARVPSNPALCFAVATALARAADGANWRNVVTYLSRMPGRDMATAGMLQAVRAKPYLQETAEFLAWSQANPTVRI